MTLKEKYFELAGRLEERYPDTSFRNHCYWRIALDNTLGARWDTVIGRPAYKHLTSARMESVVSLLEAYLQDRDLLMAHNQVSLKYRGKYHSR